MQTTEVSCMGGWCRSRAGCANYRATSGEPAERLCPKGQEWPEPVKAAGECPMCGEAHTLSQCPRWRAVRQEVVA